MLSCGRPAKDGRPNHNKVPTRMKRCGGAAEIEVRGACALRLAKVRGLTGPEGLNAATGEYGDLVKAGVIDAAKVTRSALQNAASIAALFLTTEAVIADKPEKAAAGAGGGMPGGDMDF